MHKRVGIYIHTKRFFANILIIFVARIVHVLRYFAEFAVCIYVYDIYIYIYIYIYKQHSASSV
jgi:hypothetical protein